MSGNSARRAAWWSVSAVGAYALTLTLASDSIYFLAFPGLIGLAVVVIVGVGAVLRRSFGAAVPYPTDGSDRRGAVRHHYTVLVRRYAVVAGTSVVCTGLPLVASVWFLYPLVGAGMIGLVAGTRLWLEQMAWVRRCSRVLDEYGYAFRAPVQKRNLRGGGKRTLVLGGVSPVMSACEPVCQDGWPAGITEGVWFAGDDLFGGALLVPGSGELMFLQPLDGDALADERARAGAQRLAAAQRAGLAGGSAVLPPPPDVRDDRHQPVPEANVAFAHAGTRQAWERTRRRVVRRTWLWSGLFLVALVGGLALTVATSSADRPLRSAGPALVTVALLVYLGALWACLWALSRLRQARSVLEACPWQPLAGVRRITGTTEPTGVAVQLRAPGGDWSASLSARDPRRWNRWDPELEEGAWFAGDLRTGGVLALPGGDGLMTVQRRVRVLAAEGRSVPDDHERIRHPT
ncbi:MAG TPA: hypothetical protein VD903_22040 [Pseudonocardia sp.]|nr:hypothetical protein [Pseudonocardia sp.]